MKVKITLYKTVILSTLDLLFSMYKKLLVSLFLIFLTLFTAGFSDIKQRQDYTCGPVSAANCIVNYGLFNNDQTYNVPDEESLINYFIKEAKTTAKGTKANELCKALKNYFKKHNRIAIIKYEGIRRVDKKFKAEKPIDVKEELLNGKSIILNIGVYKTDNTTYKRQYGHYVNVVDINQKGQFLVCDPYHKGSPYYVDINYKPPVNKLHNKNDNERVLKNDFEYQEITGIPYLEKDETALLNGIITINLLVF